MTQGLFIWSKTAASNGNVDTSINWQEGQAPSSVNDSARAMMARTAEYRDDNNGSLTTGGTSTAYTLTTNQNFTSAGLTALDKQSLKIVFHTTSGATPTLSVDSLTAKPLRAATGTAPPSGAFIAGTPYIFTYYNTAGEFLLDGAIPGAASIVNSQLANMAAWALKGNNTSGSAAPGDFTIDALTAKASPLVADEVPIWDVAGAAMKKATFTAIAALILSQGSSPVIQRFTNSGTYTPTAGMIRVKVRMCAGGGGGGAAFTNSGTNGNDSAFGTWTAIHGNGGGAGNAAG